MASPPPPVRAAAGPVRWLYLLLAFASLALGIVGLFLPVLPTVPFVLLAAWAAARSSPKLLHWLENHPPERCAQYHRGRRAGRNDSWSYWQVAPGQWCNQWREPCTDAVMLERLQGLPADVYKVEAGPQMVALYWGERGGEEELRRVAEVLAAVA